MNPLRDLSMALSASARVEEHELSNGAFTAVYAKSYRYGLLVADIVCFGIALLLWLVAQEYDVALLIGGCGAICLLLSVTVTSYHCYVDSYVLRESYYILFFCVKREVLWKELAYYKKKTMQTQDTYSICLYDHNRKKRISFDNGLVGFGRILKMVKRQKLNRLEK